MTNENATMFPTRKQDWKNELATTSQLTALRDFYYHAIGWNNAMAYVREKKINGMTKGQASKELNRLHELKTHGQWTGPLDWDEVKDEYGRN